MGTDEDQTTAFPPHQIIDNIYYVGTRTLSSFLVTTPEVHILIDSTYERNVRTIEQSVTDLGFAFSDNKILLGTHAHRDHHDGFDVASARPPARLPSPVRRPGTDSPPSSAARSSRATIPDPQRDEGRSLA